MSKPRVVTALQALADGDRPAARAALDPDGSPLERALAAHLDDPDADGSVYDRPAAFAAFIRGGGNVGLYEATSAALAAGYAADEVNTLLDIGCGDGAALLPALARHRVASVEVVEPSAALLATAAAGLAELAGVTVRSHRQTVQQFLATTNTSWDLVEATFALHTLPPAERITVLRELSGRTARVAFVEFDVPDLPPRSPRRWEFLADSYERGLAEYTDDRELVARGFLMPVLVGQLAPGAVRSTYEQPAAAWRAELAAAGFTDVTITPVFDYWSAPAFLLTARGGRGPR